MSEEASLPFDFNDDVPEGSPDAVFDGPALVERVMENPVPVFTPETGEFQYFGPGGLCADPFVYPLWGMDTEEHNDRMLLSDFLVWLGEKGLTPVRFTTTGWEPQLPDKLIEDYMAEERI